MEQVGGTFNQPAVPNPPGQLGEGLPSDLRVPVGNQPAPPKGSPDIQPQPPAAKPAGLATSSAPLARREPLGRKPVARRGRGWLIGLVVIFGLLLLGGTGYFLLGKINFNKGTVKFTFDPAGVNVTIDSKFARKSVSSLSISLRAGEHIAQVVKEGYLDVEREFSVVSGEASTMEIKLEPIPSVEVLVGEGVTFPGLVHNGQVLAYMTAAGECRAVDMTTKEVVSLFADATVSEVRDLIWAPGAPAAMALLDGTPKLTNMYDNRAVRGRFVPLGERPVQGAPRNRGATAWLFDDSRHTAKGWQPVLLNESVANLAFSPDSSRIIYFYWTADGEKSLVVAHSDGGEWERIATQVPVTNPELRWLNDDRHIVLFDDEQGGKAQVFDLVSKEFSEIMPDRAPNSSIGFSPDGTRVAYITGNSQSGSKLAIWNIASGSVEKVFDETVDWNFPFVWQTDEKLIVSKSDKSLWYWQLGGSVKPVQFVSAVGQLDPIKLLYSRLTQRLIVVEQERVISLRV